MSDATPASKVEMDAKLQAEIEAALGDMNVEDMLDVAEGAPAKAAARSPSAPGRRGAPGRSGAHGRPGDAGTQRQFKTGTVVQIHGDQVFVEFGPKALGMCPLSQFPEEPALGVRLEFVVERYDADEGLLTLSREGAVRKGIWENLEVGQVVEGRCIGMNKGGLEIEVAQHKAFMPAGQVDVRHIKDISIFLNEKMVVEIIELDRNRGRMIVSRKAPMLAERNRLRDKLLEELDIGQTRPAVITSIQVYGAFADLGGVDGLIHISDMSHQRLKHPSEVVKEGDQVEVQILKIDRSGEQPRIGLGMKQCLADPYQSAASELVEGAVVSGRVTRLAPFGAFVELAPGVEGLLHISELSHDRVHSVERVVKANEIVQVKILNVDPGSRRISLSLKALKEKREVDMERREDKAFRKLKARWGDLQNRGLKGGIG